MVSNTEMQATIFDPLYSYGMRDPTSSFVRVCHALGFSSVKIGRVEQFNVGMYSALVSCKENEFYVCNIGAMNVTPGFGYSDSIVLCEGDEVVFSVFPGDKRTGMILARKPTSYSRDSTHPVKIESDSKLERRTSFFSSDCYRKKSDAYDTPLKTPKDTSTGRYLCNRPTDLVPGETGSLNQHRNGFIGGMYSTSVVGGGACIRLFSLENRIRVVADSIVKYTLSGNSSEWHNRRYLSSERMACMYQEERLGMRSAGDVAFDKADYDSDGYFIKNKRKKQTLRPRIIEQEGYYGGLSAKYHVRPDPDSGPVRTMDERVKDPGVARESVDPSGQYRFAATGMIGSERIGRIPVPVRVRYPWHKDAKEPEHNQLKEFKHDENNPYYRQLELADRVAYDVKNSYARVDEAGTEFYVPDEQDLEGKLTDSYDPGFTKSTTVKLQKYDRRRSGIWQGEDGSIILRDAWGSEIVMIGGNIQISCAGNVEMLPGKTALTLAGDDIVHKAQNSIDIESADRDVRVNAFRNVQVMAGVDEDNPGGITLEANGVAGPWDASKSEGGEGVTTTGIFLKAHEGSLVTDTKYSVLRSTDITSVVSGKKTDDDDKGVSNGTVIVSSDYIHTYSGELVDINTDNASMILGGMAMMVGSDVLIASEESTAIFQGEDVLVPLMWVPTKKQIASEILDKLKPLQEYLSNEAEVALAYSEKNLEKMVFKFRSSEECGTDKSWEIDGSRDFTMFEPFWVQVKTKFETLSSVSSKTFEDHVDLWPKSVGNPWPGTAAVKTGKAKYAKLNNKNMAPVNMDDNGFNKPRKEIASSTSVVEVDIFSESGYQIRKY